MNVILNFNVLEIEYAANEPEINDAPDVCNFDLINNTCTFRPLYFPFTKHRLTGIIGFKEFRNEKNSDRAFNFYSAIWLY
jgi:hypothetical protein